MNPDTGETLSCTDNGDCCKFFAMGLTVMITLKYFQRTTSLTTSNTSKWPHGELGALCKNTVHVVLIFSDGSDHFSRMNTWFFMVEIVNLEHLNWKSIKLMNGSWLIPLSKFVTLRIWQCFLAQQYIAFFATVFFEFLTSYQLYMVYLQKIETKGRIWFSLINAFLKWIELSTRKNVNICGFERLEEHNVIVISSPGAMR